MDLLTPIRGEVNYEKPKKKVYKFWYFIQMKLKQFLLKFGISIVVIAVLFINIDMIINLMLNKQYVVKELSSSVKAVTIERMEEIISYDYVGMFYYLLINSFLISILFFIVIKNKQKKQ